MKEVKIKQRYQKIKQNLDIVNMGSEGSSHDFHIDLNKP